MTEPVALVTGGATGIGRATVIALTKQGYRVAIGHLGQESIAWALADEVGGIAVEADVADPVAVAEMVATAETFGPVEIAVCCAGFDHETPLGEVDDALWNKSMRVMLGGCVNVIAAVRPVMSARGSGSIVTISSELALLGDSDHVDYVSAKAAILGLTRAMARELAPNGVRVNAVAPGPTDTGLLTDRWREPDYLASIPLGRLGRPDEIAAVIVGIAEATFMTGQIVSPNGGMVIQ